MTTPAQKGRNGLSYADAGVDIDAGNAFVDAIKPIVKSTGRPGSNPEIGGFGGLFDLGALNYKDPLLVAANDGVGTKLKIAIDAGLHQTVGIDLVAMCVNDLIVQGAEPLFFLDYLATAKLEVEASKTIVEGIAEGCRQSGCALIGGETAEMPGMYADKDYDLAGFAVGIVERGDVLPRADVSPGDIILGLTASGAHSNGFSLIRKVVALTGLGWHDPAPFQSDTSLAEALLTPTRIYVRPILEALQSTRSIKAIAHITGGGFVENIPRVLPEGTGATIDLSAIPSLGVFEWLAEAGGTQTSEMLRTFNCGIGMVLIVDRNDVDQVGSILTAQGQEVVVLGHVGADHPGSVEFSGRLPW